MEEDDGDKCGLGQLRLAADGPGLGERQRGRGGELGSRFVGTWTCRDELPKSTFCGYCSKLRETRPTYYDCIHAPGTCEGCGTRHITVGGAGDGLRKALAIASDGVHRRQSRALSVASRAGVSLQTQDKCGCRQLRLATDGTGPGERQRRRGGELGGWSVRV